MGKRPCPPEALIVYNLLTKEQKKFLGVRPKQARLETRPQVKSLWDKYVETQRRIARIKGRSNSASRSKEDKYLAHLKRKAHAQVRRVWGDEMAPEFYIWLNKTDRKNHISLMSAPELEDLLKALYKIYPEIYIKRHYGLE